MLIQGLSRSLQRELNSFYQKLQKEDFSIQHVTKGAFSRSRSKLKPSAFAELNHVGIESFYKNAPWRSFRGFRLLAVDGSTAVLPNHPTVHSDFGITHFGPYADAPKSVARTSILYDVLNLTVLDGQIGRYEDSERELARKHLPFIDPSKDLLILDRGYPSLALMFELQAQGIDYVIRLRDDWWLEVRKMLANKDTDKEVNFKLPNNESLLLQRFNTTDRNIRCRIISIELPDGANEVLCTSVLDKNILPYHCFRELYHYRWNIEEAYKLFKNRLQLEAFSGKTSIAVQQDFYAKIFAMTTTAVLAFPIDEKLKMEQKKEKKYSRQVNRTSALSMSKEIVYHLLINKVIKKAIKAFDSVIKACPEAIRKGRSVERKKLKKKPPSMNYKQL